MLKKDPAEQTLQWLQAVVVGLNLCPFAAPVITAKQLHIDVCDQQQLELLAAAILKQLDLLQQSAESDIATSLLVFSRGLKDFNAYLDLLDTANDLLSQAGLEGVIQIASFHPDYCFHGVEEDDVSNYSNRSPYPMLHFIREAQLSRVLDYYPNPEQIPEDNIRRLRALGKEQLIALLAACH
jgi:uncharacterized protein